MSQQNGNGAPSAHSPAQQIEGLECAQAIAEANDDLESQYGYALALYRAGRIDECSRLVKRLLKTWPDNYDLRDLRRLTLERLPRKE